MYRSNHRSSWGLGMMVAIIFIALSAPDAKADLVISIEGECPGEITLFWEGATPDRNAGLAYSWSRGEWTIPGGGPCGGTTLGIVNPIRVTNFQTGPDGSGSMIGYIPPSHCGIYLQIAVLDGNPCQTSNVLQIQ